MRALEVLALLEKHGWQQIRRKGSHRVLGKGTLRQPFAYHNKELRPLEIRRLAKRFDIDYEAFFAPEPVRPVLKPSLPQIVQEPVTVTAVGREVKMTDEAVMLHLPVEALAVERSYQRHLIEPWVRELVAKWDDRLLGILTVSQRDGGYWILEGQHRVAALLARGEGKRRIPCLVFRDLTLKDEADIYLGRATTRLQTTLGLFRAKLVAKDEAALDVDRVVREVHHFDIGTGGKNSIQSIHSLFRLWDWGVLGQTFQVVSFAWGDKRDKGLYGRAPILLGIGSMVAYYGRLLDLKRLGEQLRGYTAPELQHMAAARIAAKAAKNQSAGYLVMVDVMRSIYNHRMKGNALPSADINSAIMQKWSRKVA